MIRRHAAGWGERHKYMVYRKISMENRSVVIILVLIIGVAILFSSFSEESGYAARELAKRQPTTFAGERVMEQTQGGAGGAHGDQGDVTCHAISGGRIICTDRNGKIVGYHCGWSFYTEATDSDSHEEGETCDAKEKHCPRAKETAKKWAESSCKQISLCPNFSETSTETKPNCQSQGGRLYTWCTAKITGLCKT